MPMLLEVPIIAMTLGYSTSEILKLEVEIKGLMGSETFETIPDDQKDALDELLIKVINKKEYFHSGLDHPWKLKH